MAHWFSIGGHDVLFDDGNIDVSISSSNEFACIIGKLKQAVLSNKLKSIRFNFPHITLLAKAKDQYNLSITKELLDV